MDNVSQTTNAAANGFTLTPAGTLWFTF
jgi:hypothetical protein